MRKPSSPYTFDVLSAAQVTPNMRRVTIGGDAMQTFPAHQAGGYVKLRLPASDGSKHPLVRTYTIRHQRADALDIDFALHGDANGGGPAARWSLNAAPGDQITLSGPGPAKPLPQGADGYFIVGDMTSLPAISVNLEALPSDARGTAIIEVQTPADVQEIDHPEAVNIHWLFNPHPGTHPERMRRAIAGAPWPDGRVYAWSASEFDVMRGARNYFRQHRQLGNDQLYISSYWKKGVGEDKHRDIKRADAWSQD